MVLFLVLFKLSRVVGLCNFRYVPKSGRFKLDKGARKIFYIVLHFIYMLIVPCALSMMLYGNYNCQKLDMLAIAYTIVSIAKVVSLFMLLFSVWLLKTQWLHAMNGFMVFHQTYRTELRHYALISCWKNVMTLSRFVLLFMQLFGPTSIFMCVKFNEKRAQFVLYYVLMSLAILLMELILTCASYWMYSLINLSNRVLGFMSKEVQRLRKDLNRLPQQSGSNRNIYQQQLYATWHKFWRRCMQLDRLIQYLLHFGQWQILLNLFSCYLSDIAGIFNIVIYSAESGNFHLPYCITYLLLSIMFHLDFMSYFAIFGINRLQWKYLLSNIEELWYIIGALDFDPSADTYCIAMQRQISFAIIAINRRQHRRQDRVRRLQIAGLFDMNPRTGYRMTINIVMNVVVLWQIAYKYYY